MKSTPQLCWQVGCPHSQAISTSPLPASRHESLQYSWPCGTRQRQGMCAHSFGSSLVMIFFPLSLSVFPSLDCRAYRQPSISITEKNDSHYKRPRELE